MAQKDIFYRGQGFGISYEILYPNISKTIVFLHGWGSNKGLMQQAFGDSFKDFCHLYIDMPGFGKSKLPPFALETKDYAEIIRIFLEKFQMDICMVVGHSFGGKVAAMLEPKELILLSSAGIIVQKPLKTKIKISIAKILNKLSPQLSKAFKNLLRSKDVEGMNEVMYQTFKNVVNEDFSQIFKSFKNKTFIFWGDKDTATPVASGEKIHSLIQDSKFFVLEGDHYFFLKQAKKIEKLYRDN